MKNNKSYVLLNNEFLSSYFNNVNANPIKFYLSHQSIKVEIKEGISLLNFTTNDNILNFSKINSEPRDRSSQHQENPMNQNSSLNKKDNNQEGSPQNQIPNGGQENIITTTPTPTPTPPFL